MSDLLEEARRRYAEELRFTARLSSRAVIDAFAAVPRERFFRPGPWHLLNPMALGDYWTTEDADPRHLYHDVLIAIDEGRRLNNGQPSLWARMYDQLDFREGAHVVYVGAGTGYYSATLAETNSYTADGSERSRVNECRDAGGDLSADRAQPGDRRGKN